MTPSSAIRLDNLRKMVALHETYWKAAAQHNPRVTSWIEREWEPWVVDWFGIAWPRVPSEQVPELLVEKAGSLRELRERAALQEIPLPDLSAVHPQMDPHPVDPYPQMDSVAQLNKIANERFWDQTGYKRGHKLSRRDPEDVAMMPVWTSIRRQVAQEAAQQAARDAADALAAPSATIRPGPAGIVSGPDTIKIPVLNGDLYATALFALWQPTHEHTRFGARIPSFYLDTSHADMRGFWFEDPAGELFDRGPAAGRRFVLYQSMSVPKIIDSAVGLQSPDPWRVMRSAPPAKVMHLPMPYYQRDFIGADPQANGAGRTGVLAKVAPVLAPATGGFTAKVVLDDHQRLNVAICVDGKCYETSMDLAPAIAAVMSKIAHEHAAMHAASPDAAHAPPTISGELAINAIDHAVGVAGDEMVAALIDRHIDCVCGGWLDDIGGAIKGVAQKLKGPITAAATAVANAVGGPAAGAAASQFVGTLIDKAAGSPKAAAQIAVVKEEAKTNPGIAEALATAQKAVANTLAAYHVEDTAKKAAAGQPEAQQELAKVAKAAQQGDPAAHAVTDIVKNAFATTIEKRATERRVVRMPASKRRPFVPMEGREQFLASIDDETDRRYTAQTNYAGPRPDRHDPQTARRVPGWLSVRYQVVQEIAANREARKPTEETVSGEPWFDMVSGTWVDIVEPMGVAMRASHSPDPLVGGQPWVNLVGADGSARATIDRLRKQAAKQAAASTGGVVGVVRTSTGQWITQAFASVDDADDWFGIAKHDPTTFIYAAYFEKGSTGPAIVNEAFGRGSTPREPARGQEIPRDSVATTSGDDIIGAAIDALREQARRIAAETAGGVIGVARLANGEWSAQPFRSTDDADDWFGVVKHDPTTFSYAAYFEKGSTGPAIVNEEIGQGHVPRPATPGGPAMRRGVATTQGEFAA